MRAFVAMGAFVATLFGSTAADALTIIGNYTPTTELAPLGTMPLQFGISVAISGDEAVVAAPKQMGAASGNVIVYRRDAMGAWNVETSLSDPEPANDFGTYLGCNGLAISGDRVVLGTPSANGDQGAVRVFARTSTGWIQEQVLSDTMGAPFDSFGCGVGIWGDYIVVGAPHIGSAGGGYVYQRSGDTGWALLKRLTPTGAAAGASVGISTAIDGDTVVLGASHDNADHGAAYVFKKSGTAWPQHKLVAADGAAGDAFGASVAISKGTVAVGAPVHSSGGAAYVYAGAGFGLQIETLSAARNFGSAVAISGDRLVVGAIGDDEAKVFTRRGSVWDSHGTFAGTLSSRFGGAVAVSGTTVLVGAINDSVTGVVYTLEDDEIFWNGFE